MSRLADRLYRLLPVVHRLRDAQREDGGTDDALRALIGILGDELDRVRQELESQYDDAFVETARADALDRLGHDLGLRILQRPQTGQGTSFHARGWVGNAVGWRRRKGTTGSLGDIAGQVTSYDAWVLEHADQLVTTGSTRHELLGMGTYDVRGAPQSPIGPIPTVPDVRNPDGLTPRANLPNVSIVLWRTSRWLLQRSEAVSMNVPGVAAFHIDPRGKDVPLYATPPDDDSGSFLRRLPLPLPRRDVAALMDAGDPPPVSLQVVGRSGGEVVRRTAANLRICHLGEIETVPPSVDPEEALVDPELGRVVVGRDLVADLDDAAVLVDAIVPRVAPIGAGPWVAQRDAERRIQPDATVGGTGPERVTFQITVRAAANDPEVDDGVMRSEVRDLERAFSRIETITRPGSADEILLDGDSVLLRVDSLLQLSAWPDPSARVGIAVWVRCRATDQEEEHDTEALGTSVVIRASTLGQTPPSTNPADYDVVVLHTVVLLLADSRSHAAPTAALPLRPGVNLSILAASWPRDPDPIGDLQDGFVRGRVAAQALRPRIRGNLAFEGSALPDGPGSTLTMLGVWQDGPLELGGDLGSVVIDTCTLPSLRIAAGSGRAASVESVTIERSEVGEVQVEGVLAVRVIDSVVRSAFEVPEGTVALDQVTLLGPARVSVLDASNCIFDDTLEVARTQTGCIRFSWVTTEETPRRHRCEPDRSFEGLDLDALERARKVATLRPSWASVDPTEPGFATLRPDTPLPTATAGEDGGEPGSHFMLEHALRVDNTLTVLDDQVRFGPAYGLYVLI